MRPLAALQSLAIFPLIGCLAAVVIRCLRVKVLAALIGTESIPGVIDLGSLIRRLSVLEDSKVNPVFVVVVKGRDLGRTVVVTEQLLRGSLDIEGMDNHALPAAP